MALFMSKNLYNKANYIVRQEFIQTSKLKQEGKLQTAKYLNYYDINRILIDSKDNDYNALPRKVSNQVLMGLDRNWKAFFTTIKNWSKNKGKYKGIPKLPNYKDKKGRNILNYEAQAISSKSLKKGFIKLSGLNIEIPFINKEQKLIEVKIKPTSNLNIEIHIIYEKKEKELKTETKNIIGIDLGVNNLMALTSNVKGFDPLVINGRPLKSINQFYSKMLGKYKSELPNQRKTSKKIKTLTCKRNNKVKNYLHRASKYLIDVCLANNIDTIVIGINKDWKDKVNLKDKGNQNFVGIPHSTLIHMIEYKGKLEGIKVIVREESYTSVASFLDHDEIPNYGSKHSVVFSGKRIKRGLYQTQDKLLINADINGSYNIIRKEFPKSFEGLEGVAVHPRVVRL